MTLLDAFLDQNDLLAADLTKEDRDALRPYVEHHSGGLIVAVDGLAVTSQSPPHDCGLCDGRLAFIEVGADGHMTWRCLPCGWWHTSKDCCDAMPALLVKLHDSWGDPDDGPIVVHTYDPDEVDETGEIDTVEYFHSGHEAVAHFLRLIAG